MQGRGGVAFQHRVYSSLPFYFLALFAARDVKSPLERRGLALRAGGGAVTRVQTQAGRTQEPGNNVGELLGTFPYDASSLTARVLESAHTLVRCRSYRSASGVVSTVGRGAFPARCNRRAPPRPPPLGRPPGPPARAGSGTNWQLPPLILLPGDGEEAGPTCKRRRLLQGNGRRQRSGRAAALALL